MKVKLGIIGAVSFGVLSVACGGAPEEQVEGAQLGDVSQAIENQQIDAGQTRDFSTWLTGATTFKLYNLSTTKSVPYYAYCGGNSTSGTVPAGSNITSSLMCNWFGARLYIRNNGTQTGVQVLDAYTY